MLLKQNDPRQQHLGVRAQPAPPAYPGSMEHVWQALQQEEGAEAREAVNGLQDNGRTDGLTNGAHPAAQARDKCWIHRVRAACAAAEFSVCSSSPMWSPTTLCTVLSGPRFLPVGGSMRVRDLMVWQCRQVTHSCGFRKRHYHSRATSPSVTWP